MCAALDRAHGIVNRWLVDHPACFPPTVIHITDGESTDGDPSMAMLRLKALASSDGEVLLFNLHLSAVQGVRPISFPSSSSQLPDEYARTLFEGASELTPFMRTVAEEQGIYAPEGARGFVLNGDITMIIRALEIGTRPANLR